MPTTAFNGIRRVADGLAPDPTPDGELLARYANHGDAAAFDTLVRRHAGMVFGTCRRVLGNADADDAYQATFVVLVRKAGSLTDRQGLGGFLHGVAFHTALKVRAMAAQRRTKEARAERPESPPDRSDVLAALDEELARLPEKYREPVVLCDLEGRSRRDAADAFGVPQGTISSRLATAHRMLEKRLRSRGFTGVCVAVLLAGHVSASTDALADAAVRAVLVPSKTVSFLAAEVSKMLLLHKFRLGVLVLSAVLVGIAAAVAATDTPPPQPPAAKGTPPQPPAAAAVKEPAWKTEFRKTYGLKDGELIRRVPLPHPECRAEYFKDLMREFYKRSKLEPVPEAVNKDYTDYFTKFGWGDGWTVDSLIMHTTPIKPEVGQRLVALIHMTTGFPHTRTNGDAELLEQKVTGDFVVRADADPTKLAAALESILRKECGLNVSLAVQEVERNVYVLSGKYESKPVAGRKKDKVEVYATELGDTKTGGGGTGSLRELADHVEGFIEYPVVLGEVAGAPKRVEWHYNYRSPVTAEQRAQDHDPEAVMLNVSEQTGLTAKVEKRKIKVLVVKHAQ